MEAWLGIGSLARQSGLTPDTLRKWEVRHGFPRPQRSDGGTRRYSPATLDQLISVQRLISQGQRPAMAIEQIIADCGDAPHTPPPADPARFNTLLAWRSDQDSAEQVKQLEQRLDATDPATFIERVAAPLMTEAGEAWARGEIEIYAIHGLCAEMQRLVHLARERIPTPLPGAPRVLLVTRPVEKHLLGPAMAACLIEAAGARCLDGGVGLPTCEVTSAVSAWRADIIAVSASRAGSKRSFGDYLFQLRARNPDVPLWLGGQGALRLPRTPANCRQLQTLEDIRSAVQDSAAATPRRL